MASFPPAKVVAGSQDRWLWRRLAARVSVLIVHYAVPAGVQPDLATLADAHLSPVDDPQAAILVVPCADGLARLELPGFDGGRQDFDLIVFQDAQDGECPEDEKRWKKVSRSHSSGWRVSSSFSVDA